MKGEPKPSRHAASLGLGPVPRQIDTDAAPRAAERKSLPERIRALPDRSHCFDLAMKAVGLGGTDAMCASLRIAAEVAAPLSPAEIDGLL